MTIEQNHLNSPPVGVVSGDPTPTGLNADTPVCSAGIYPTYPAYKDSGVDWLGEIPAHWEVKRIKFLFKEKNIRSTTGAEELLSLSKFHGVIPRKEITDKVESATSLINYKTCVKGDMIINKLQAWNGMLDISKYDGIVSPDYSVYQALNKKINKAFFKYLFKTSNYVGEFAKNSSGIGDGFFRLYTDDFFRIWSILPPLSEQTRIAEFLDRKTVQIDEAIAQKERLIMLLNERRQVLIHRAVTRSLNPNVPMKDSGIEWIGEIPAHWEVKFNRRLFRENSRKIINRDELPLSLSQVDGVTPSNSLKERSLSPAHRDNFKLCLPGDLLVNRFKGHLGVFFESPYRGIVTFHYGVFEPERGVNSKYFELLYHTEIYKTVYAGASNGMTIGLQNLSNQNFYDVKSIVPLFNEQKQIVEYADSLTKRFLKAKNIIQTQIQKLQELKATLINSAVTGKIRV